MIPILKCLITYIIIIDFAARSPPVRCYLTGRGWKSSFLSDMSVKTMWRGTWHTKRQEKCISYQFFMPVKDVWLANGQRYRNRKEAQARLRLRLVCISLNLNARYWILIILKRRDYIDLCVNDQLIGLNLSLLPYKDMLIKFIIVFWRDVWERDT